MVGIEPRNSTQITKFESNKNRIYLYSAKRVVQLRVLFDLEWWVRDTFRSNSHAASILIIYNRFERLHWEN